MRQGWELEPEGHARTGSGGPQRLGNIQAHALLDQPDLRPGHGPGPPGPHGQEAVQLGRVGHDPLVGLAEGLQGLDRGVGDAALQLGVTARPGTVRF